MSIYRVAARAGVSIATVSRVLNQKENVAPETRERVLEAVEQLHYIPNAIGRNLRVRRTKTVLCLVPTLQNPLYASLLAGAQACADEYGYSVLLGISDHRSEREQEFCGMACSGMVDGLLYASPGIDTAELVRVARTVPLVQCFDYRREVYAPAVTVDDEQAAYDAVQYLYRTGCRRIGMISASDRQSSSKLREQGYKRALRECELPVEARYLVRAPYDRTRSMTQVRSLLTRAPELDGVFCVSDELAYAAIRVAKAMGRRVPEDLAVIGHDNSTLSETVTPSITTVQQESRQIGYQAMGLLRHRFLTDVPLTREHVFVPHMLVERASTRSPA